MTLGEWIDHVAGRFDDAGLHYGHGTDNAFDEAAWLVLHVTGQPLQALADIEGRELSEDEARRVEELATRRIDEKVPLAYLTGTAMFAGLEFEVDPAVLVPRSPIAELVDEGFAPWREPESVRRVLDLCTGSGCIAVATAVALPWARVDAADVSDAALAVATRNVARHGVEDRVGVVRSDLFEALEGRRYDVIVTNPPYVPESRLQELPGEYRREPEIGLVSGADGLDACLRIMLQCAIHLNEQGILVCEVGEARESLESLLPEVPFLWLEFRQGGEGVFLLDRQQLLDARGHVETRVGKRDDVG